ncbi:MAG: class I SAM-dependent methyltransferase [Chloroflexota bacterium]
MADQEVRYDRIAEGYARWWSPVHRSATLRLLDEITGDVDAAGGAARILDLGCGTGALGIAAAERWPKVRIEALDASEGMLAIARRELAATAAEVRARVLPVHGYADRLSFEDGAFDIVLTAFVLQLVPSAPRALRELHRVLRPGGRIAFVRWLDGGTPCDGEAAYDQALVAAGLEARDPDAGGPDLASPAAAAAQLRRAGFRATSARAATLVHDFTPEGFAGFITRFDDEDLFLTMEPGLRESLEADLLARLSALPPGGLRMELPIVYGSGRRV